MVGVRTPCRACGARPAVRPRLLCWGCYEDPAVRRLHGRLPCRANDRGVGAAEPALPPGPPTAARPGSAAKVAVLCVRAAENRPLWVSGDARCE